MDVGMSRVTQARVLTVPLLLFILKVLNSNLGFLINKVGVGMKWKEEAVVGNCL
jgi:hypothetical protein